MERLAAMTYSRLKAELAEESEEVIAAMGQVKQDDVAIAQGLQRQACAVCQGMGRRKQDVRLHVSQRQMRKRGIEINIIKRSYFDIAVVEQALQFVERSFADFDPPSSGWRSRKSTRRPGRKTVTVSRNILLRESLEPTRPTPVPYWRLLRREPPETAPGPEKYFRRQRNTSGMMANQQLQAECFFELHNRRRQGRL